MLTAGSPIQLIIADDHFATRRGLKDFLNARSGMNVMAFAANGKEVLEVMRTCSPHIVLTDVKMPVIDGRALCKTVRIEHPKTRVIAYTMFDDPQAIIDMRSAGASGYVLKDANEEELIKAIFAVYDGGEYYCTSIKQRIDSLFSTGQLGRPLQELNYDLSETEVKIIKLIVAEKSSKDIGCELNLSKRTVEHYQEKIRVKMGVRSAVGIAVHAIMDWLLYQG